VVGTAPTGTYSGGMPRGDAPTPKHNFDSIYLGLTKQYSKNLIWVMKILIIKPVEKR
jgi:hypothetical protein